MPTRCGSRGSNGSLRRVSELYRTSGIGRSIAANLGRSRSNKLIAARVNRQSPARRKAPPRSAALNSMPVALRWRTCERAGMQALQSAPSVAAPSQRASPLALLASRRFGPLFATQFLSAFNDNALKNALVLMVAYRADAGDALSAGLLIPLASGLFILPFFLCSASAGALADGSDKAWLARVIKLIEIAVMVAAAVGIVAGSTALLLALLFAMGIEAAFFGPIKYAILPDLLAPDELLLGNALVEAGTFFAILLGTIAGMLIATGHGQFTSRDADRPGRDRRLDRQPGDPGDAPSFGAGSVSLEPGHGHGAADPRGGGMAGAVPRDARDL